MELLQNTKDVPSRSTLIVWGEFLELTGTTPDRLSELMDIGWLKPTRTAEAALLFRQDDVYRIRKLEQAPPCRAGLRFAQRRAEGRSVFADTFRAAFVVPC